MEWHTQTLTLTPENSTLMEPRTSTRADFFNNFNLCHGDIVRRVYAVPPSRAMQYPVIMRYA